MPRSSKLTTTSFAILGQLSFRPFTAYQLNLELARNVRWFWPQAESQLYAEIKRLAEQGLARGRVRRSSGRRSIEYHLTRAGRHALAAWLATPPAARFLELEGLLRVLYATSGTPTDLERSLGQVEHFADGMRRFGQAIAADLADQSAMVRKEAPLRRMMFELSWNLSGELRAWAARWGKEVRQWPSWKGLPRQAPRALAAIRKLAARDKTTARDTRRLAEPATKKATRARPKTREARKPRSPAGLRRRPRTKRK